MLTKDAYPPAELTELERLGFTGDASRMSAADAFVHVLQLKLSRKGHLADRERVGFPTVKSDRD